MGHRVAQSLVGSEGCIIQPRRSCILELKNGGNGRAPPRQRPPGVPKRASLQLPSHYLFNVTRPREDNARRHSQILPSLFFTFLFRSVDGFPPVWVTLVLSLYPGSPLHPLLALTPTSHPVPFARVFNFWLNFLPTRLSTAERERLSAVDGRLRLVASSQTRIKRAIDVGKSPGNLPARPLSWITLAGSVLCTPWLIERNGDCIRKHAYW